jgi:hypothetical protein
LGSVFDEDGKRLHPGAPLALKESITVDVLVMDQVVRETGTDSETGEETDWSSDPNLVSVASGVLWNRHGSTMLRRGGQGMDPNDLILRLFETIVKIVPNGCNVTYATSSDWLFDQWRDMMGWREIGYKGLDPNDCMFQWKGIMEHVDQRIGTVTMVKIQEIVIDPKMYQAVSMYAEEGIHWYHEYMATPVGAEYPPAAPEV